MKICFFLCLFAFLTNPYYLYAATDHTIQHAMNRSVPSPEKPVFSTELFSSSQYQSAHDIYYYLAKQGNVQFTKQVLAPHRKLTPIPNQTLQEQTDVLNRLILSGNYKLYAYFMTKKIITKKAITDDAVSYALERKEMGRDNFRIFIALFKQKYSHRQLQRFLKQETRITIDQAQLETESKNIPECSICLFPLAHACTQKNTEKYLITNSHILCKNQHRTHTGCFFALLLHKFSTCPYCRELLALSKEENYFFIKQQQKQKKRKDAVQLRRELILLRQAQQRVFHEQ